LPPLGAFRPDPRSKNDRAPSPIRGCKLGKQFHPLISEIVQKLPRKWDTQQRRIRRHVTRTKSTQRNENVQNANYEQHRNQEIVLGLESIHIFQYIFTRLKSRHFFPVFLNNQFFICE
jgi:hypothetical protein